ncbi:hypothetical protein GCM10011348_29190 [Marinobacterium nitratireducens]|uniref:Plasmid pRiA4b Orf3-like domain-containing protein n=1 Tax=Marinobacterium nitratireducens TaxID=518897 RepID=A0A917ZJQ8_9GAMM|nr:plasmid pRiA4b ORF-3 family protein [Marinobacterium nitratireducens]GGO83988.1 hypothetical protein GCM10011348_29190 [Marinobacterium nitratireducens]
MAPDPESDHPICVAGRRAAPPEDCGGAWNYLEQLQRHEGHLLWQDIETVATAVERFLDTGDRSALGNLDALRAVMARVEAYTAFQPERFDRQAINARLRQWTNGAGGEA